MSNQKIYSVSVWLLLLTLILTWLAFTPTTTTANAPLAVGDVVSVTINPDGWSANITLEGMTAGGVYDMGLGPDYTFGPQTKIVFQVVSLGFDNQGNPTTIQRTVYASKPVRQPYPNNNLMDETASGGNLTVRVALSDYIYVKDKAGAGNSGTNVRVSIQSGFYSAGGQSNQAVGNMLITNNSQEPYPRVVGNWSWYPYRRIDGPTFTLRSVAFHGSAQSGRPVRAVRFTAIDRHGHSTTTLVTQPIIDSSMADAEKVIEYVAEMSATELTQGDVITCHFTAYPWVGDDASVLDTADGVNTPPTPLYAPLLLLNDKAGDYGVTVAVVDAAGGNDTTGVAVDATAFDPLTPPLAFETIAGAINRIYQYNQNLGRDNVGGAVIYLQQGEHAWTGGTVTAGNTPDTLVTITRFPGVARENVSIAGSSGSKDISGRVRLYDLTLMPVSMTFSNIEVLVVEKCAIDTSDTPAFYVLNNTYWLHNDITDTGGGALSPYSTVNSSPVLVRGNHFLPGYNQAIFIYTVLGNRIYNNSGLSNQKYAQTIPLSDNCTLAFNRITVSSTRVLGISQDTGEIRHGAAVVQNVFERQESGAQPNVQIAADGSTGEVDNVLLWYNTLIGQRYNGAYNDNGDAPAWRKHWSVKNNNFDDYNIKSDLFTPPNGNRIGNWSGLYGVGHSGNAKVHITGMGASGFDDEFPGPSSLVLRNQDVTFYHYQNNRSASGDGAGNGDYHLTPESPVRQLAQDRLLPYDLEGESRLYGGDSGAYEYPRLQLHLEGRTGDQTAILAWEVIGALPVTATWQIDYYTQTMTIPFIATNDNNATRAYTLTNLTNNEWYTVTLHAILDGTSWLSDTVWVMPTEYNDQSVYLPLVVK